jgi:opacity protein-like surface antigen
MRSGAAGVVATLLGVGAAMAADMPGERPLVGVAPPLHSWSGLYLGLHTGAGTGATQFADPAGPSLYGGTVRTPSALGGGQVGYNWQIPHSRWVFGLEADASGLAGNGSNTCFASSGMFSSANCTVAPRLTASVAGRVGYAAGAQGRTLLFAKAGMAWLDQRLDTANIALDVISTSGVNDWRSGWTAGLGVEQALSPAWSVKLEYDYAGFGSTTMPTLPSAMLVVTPSVGFIATPGSLSTVSQATQSVKLGLNLKLGEDTRAHWIDDATPLGLRGIAERPPIATPEVEIGARAWVSTGRYQKDLGGTTDSSQQNVLVSRLTYDTSAASGEVFGRIDSPTDIFLKGFVGGGGLTSGKMHDEDWMAFGILPYSNTVSDPVKGSLAYATFDAGYDVLRGHTYKVGGFVGYNYYRETKSAYGCTQIANPYSDCIPSLSNTTLIITEDGAWNSLRIGVNADVNLTDRLRLIADAAYLPYARYSGTDNHLLRTDMPSTISPEHGTGQGVQLEAVMSYALANAWSVGVGGRYWAMWTTTDAFTNLFGTACPCQTLPSRSERYGAFLQASYQINGMR